MTISFPLESNSPSPQRRSHLKQTMTRTMLGATLGAIFIGSTAIASRAADPQHLQQLLQTNSCENCDLRGAGLVYGNLQGANLQGANLQGANLSRANLRYANLQGANLESTTLFGADLSGAQLHSARLGGSDLREAMLYGADMTGADVRQALLNGAMGVPTSVVGARDHFNWGVQEADRDNFPGAIRYYSQELAIDENFAEAYLNRAVALAHLADYDGALSDSSQAQMLFQQQGDPAGAKAAETFATNLKKYLKEARREERGGNGIGISILDFVRGAGSFIIPLLL